MKKKSNYSIDQFCGIGDEAAPDITNQIKTHQQLGWNKLELRSIDNIPLFLFSDLEMELIYKQIVQSNITIPIIDSTIGNWDKTISQSFQKDLKELKVLIKIAKKFNSNYIRIMSYPNDNLSDKDWESEVIKRICSMAKIAYNEGVVLLHENCHGWAASDPFKALHLVDVTNGKGFGLLFDTGNPIVHNYNCLNYCKKILDHIKHVHIKDAVLSKNSKNEIFTFPGEGDAPILECLKLLSDNGYKGLISIEPHLIFAPHKTLNIAQVKQKNIYIRYAHYLYSMLGDCFAN